MCLDEKLVGIWLTDHLSEEITEIRLQLWMDVNLGLFNGNDLPL
jgi:hypothetical protein